MTAYNQINGTYANESKHLLGDILYGEWQYDGMVVSDWGGSNDHVEACDRVLIWKCLPPERWGQKQIVRAVQEGRLEEQIWISA